MTIELAWSKDTAYWRWVGLGRVVFRRLVGLGDDMVTLEMPPAQMLRQVQADLGLTDNEMASALAISPSALQLWHAGGAVPEDEPRRRLRILAELDNRLQETFVAEDVPGWLRNSNRYLGGGTPAEYLRDGHFERVEGALEIIDSGIFI